MPQVINLADKIEKQLPPELAVFFKQAGDLAAGRGEGIYLVGGAVRDLLLDKTNLDIDLAVEGDAAALASELIKGIGGKITTHSQFKTANISWQNYSIDLAMARSEIYNRPGALPAVKSGSIKDDLFRRDFSINAMAVELNSQTYGNLIDPYSGQKDLRDRLIRILHEKSFIDDSTRIWRGLRYEQRLDFQLEAATLNLLKRGVPMLDSISGDRIRYELECILQEEKPEKVLRRADELGVLKKLNPSLKGNSWLVKKYSDIRQISLPDKPPPALYMALLTYNLSDEEREEFICYLRLPKATARILRDSGSVRKIIGELADATMNPGSVYRLLQSYSPLAISTGIIVGDSDESCRNMQLFLDKLRHIKLLLNGNDLIDMGIPRGPRIKDILNKLLYARLDGKVKTRQDEVRMVMKNAG
jgi:tRNA nucleotidyltransferase (CCA-adding enzyme)